MSHADAAGLGSGAGPAWRGLVLGLGLAGTAVALAAGADLARAEQLVRDGKYQDAYDLLAPFEAENKGDAAFNNLLGQAALRTGRADKALEFFQRSLAAAPSSVDAHLGLGRAYLALGNHGSAKIEFETVLRFDDLPPDLHRQAEIYAEAAEGYAQGERLLGNGYAIVGYGNYHTGLSGGGPENDGFFAARVGGSLNYELGDGLSLDGSLDYRYRNYHDNPDRRDDSDLRWNGAVGKTIGEGRAGVGVRGRVSYCGDGNHRNDFGLYGDYRLRLDADNQLSAGAEIRQRRYPNGVLRERTRNIVELSGGWTRSLLDGKASFSLAASGGREFNTQRSDGDSNFFSLSPSLNFTLTEQLGGFVFARYQRSRYNIERLNTDAADQIGGIGKRNDNEYEVGGGLTWQFAEGWSLNPEVLYIRDQSNILSLDYSSTEVWITLRKDF